MSVVYTSRFALRIVSVEKIDDKEYVKDLCEHYVNQFYNTTFIIPAKYRIVINYGEYDETVRGYNTYDTDSLAMKEVNLECNLEFENRDLNYIKLVHPDVYDTLNKFNNNFIKRFVHVK